MDTFESRTRTLWLHDWLDEKQDDLGCGFQLWRPQQQLHTEGVQDQSSNPRKIDRRFICRHRFLNETGCTDRPINRLVLYKEPISHNLLEYGIYIYFYWVYQTQDLNLCRCIKRQDFIKIRVTIWLIVDTWKPARDAAEWQGQGGPFLPTDRIAAINETKQDWEPIEAYLEFWQRENTSGENRSQITDVWTAIRGDDDVQFGWRISSPNTVQCT